MVALKWKTEKRIIKDLIPLDFNPRKISPERQQSLKNSIEKFNLVDIPVINKDNSIISGRQRIEIYVLAGRENEEIEVRVPNRQLSEPELKEYMLIANTHAGEFVPEILEAHFSETEIEFHIPIYEDEKNPDFSKKNKEIDVSSFKDEMQMKMTFTNDNFLRVKGELNRLKMTPEQCLLKFLFNE